MKKLLLAFLSTCMISCSENVYFNHFKAENRSLKNISIKNLLMDQIILDSIGTSNIGIFAIAEESILFIDYVLCQVFTFDIDGKLCSHSLGKGRGPKEINAGYIETYCRLRNGNHLFISQPWDVHIFDPKWNRIYEFRIDYQADISDIYATRNPSPEEPRLYSFEYEKFTPRSNSRNEILLPIYSEHQNFNPWSSFNYYKNGRILARLDIENQSISSIFGRRSPEYLKYKFVGHHSFFTFDIDTSDNLYISHEIDSLIYVYDSNHNPLYTFGFAGGNMNTDYQEISRLDITEIRRLYREDKPGRGFYKEIKYCDHNNYLFRSYNKNGVTPYDGLQIYLESELIGDVDVPKGFSVIGYISPFYLGSVVDEREETIEIYKFVLPDI